MPLVELGRKFRPNQVKRSAPPPAKPAPSLVCRHGFWRRMTYIGPYGRELVTDHNDCPDQ